MKRCLKRGVVILLAMTVCVYVFMIGACAAKSVKLESEQSAAYSNSVIGTWKYVNETTKNDSSSKQRMRVQFEVKPVFSFRNIFLRKSGFNFEWASEKRVFVNVGESAPYFESNRYNNDLKFRLAISPEDQETKGVFGKGTIYH